MNDTMVRVGDTVSFLDPDLKKWLTYTKVTSYADGSPMSDAKVLSSGKIYAKIESEYFLQEHSEGFSTDSMFIDKTGLTDVSDALITLFTVARTFNKKIKLGNPGETFLVSKMLSLSDGMHIYGNGTLLRAPNTGVNILRAVGSYIVLEGLTINGNRQNQASLNYNAEITLINSLYCIVKNCTVVDSRLNGIAAFNTSYCSIENNVVRNTYANAIFIADGSSNFNTIKDNKCIDTDTQNCIFITASSGSQSTTTHLFGNSIINNKCYGAGDIGIESGIQTHNTIIAYNDIRRSKNEAIIIRDNTGNVITNNTIDGTRKVAGQGTGFAISFHDQLPENSSKIYDAICSGNVITNFENVGINSYARGIRIFDNIITKNGTGGAGINLAHRNYAIHGNKITGGEIGIRIKDSNLTDADIYTNEVRDSVYFISTDKVLTDVRIFSNKSNTISSFSGASFINAVFFDNRVPSQVLPNLLGKSAESRLISLPTVKFAAVPVVVRPINGLMVVSSNTINAVYHLAYTAVSTVVSSNGVIGQTGQKYNVEFENGAWVIKRQANTDANDIASVNVSFIEA